MKGICRRFGEDTTVPTKAILGYLYLHPQHDSADAFNELRLNAVELMEKLDVGVFERYLEQLASKALRVRARA